MNLNVSPRPDGRKYLSIVKAYRDPFTKRPTSKTIQSLGYLDNLEKDFPDPVTHFKEVALKMTADEKAAKHAALSFSMDEELAADTSDRRNYGYAAIMEIYHELLLHEHFAAKARYRKFEFNTNSIMLLLVISRILSPGSKKKAFEGKGRYFERFDFELADVYRALSHFAKIGKDTQKFLHGQITKNYGRDTSVVYFDTTNFCFEIDEQDDLRKRGVSKEHRPNPIVQMGLAMDKDGVPINYKIFPGNKHDSGAFRDVIREICINYSPGRIIAVGDMGIITADSIWFLINGKPHKPKHGYVFSYSVRKAAKKFKGYVLDEAGYLNAEGRPAAEADDYKVKTRCMAREIEINAARNGNETKVTKIVQEKQVVFWSRKYADKAKAEREAMLNKALRFIKEPVGYKRHTGHGSAKYINGIDKETGEVNPETLLSINRELVSEEEKYDGYYAIVTSELEARPVFVSREDHIDAHFLTCFISLVIVRLLQKKTGRGYSIETLVDAMKCLSCSREEGNLYLFDYRSPVTDAISEAVNIDFKKKRMRLGEIKKSLGNVKK